MSVQDDRYAQYEPAIVDGQEQFYAEYGKPWQGVLSHFEDQLPQGGEEKAADNWGDAPTDQGWPWKQALDEWGLSDLDKYWTQAIRVDTWATGLKIGYTVTRLWLDSDGNEVEKTHEYVLEDNTQPQPEDPYTTVWVKAPDQSSFDDAMRTAGLAEEVTIDEETVLRYANGVHWIGDFYAVAETWDEDQEQWTGGELDGRQVGAIRLSDPSRLDGLSGITVLDSKPEGELPIVE